jgi:hypothetical protein
MPDAMDQCQQFNDDQTEDALRRHADRARPVGLSHCERSDCREPIKPERTALGARLCMECQHEEEAREAHFRGWKRPR